MSWDDVSDSVCNVACALSLVGDRWTLLIMRELSMDNRRFDDILAQTRMSSFLLSTRLKRMEEDGLIERRLYNERPPRYEYFATEKGKELDGVLLALRAWGMRWQLSPLKGKPAVALTHKDTGEEIDAHWQCPPNGKLFSFDDTIPTISKAFAKERKARSEAAQITKKNKIKESK